MRPFNARIAAAAAALLGATYLVAGLASGHSARSEPPIDLSAKAAEASLDVWKTAAALIDEGPGRALLVDVRDREEWALYHLPRSVHEPGADPARIAQLAREHAPLIVVASRDEQARKLVAEARAAVSPDAPIHYLADGPRAFYLAFELPVPLFADVAAPAGYERALAEVRAFLAGREPASKKAQALEALQTLARVSFQPTLLKQSGKPKPAGNARKKITGGCG